MGRKPRLAYIETIKKTKDRVPYTQAGLADLAIELELISEQERKIAKTAFRRFVLEIKPDLFITLRGHGGKYPAWYGQTLKDALKERD